MTAQIRSDTIYQAIFDDEALAALPSWLARAAEARSVVIQWRHNDGAHEIMAFCHHGREFMDAYAASYAAIDPWVWIAINAPGRGEILRLDEHMTREVFENSRFAQDFLRARGDDTSHLAGVAFTTPWGRGMVCLQRGAGDRPFTAADLDGLHELAPHLDVLLRVRGETAAHRRLAMVSRDALDALALGAILARADGEVVQVNIAADTVLRRADGLRLERGRLVSPDRASDARLADALRRATATVGAESTAIAIARGADTLDYLVSVTPLAMNSGPALALVVFRDPDLAEDSLVQSVRNLFGLTRGEAAVAVDLSRGLSTAAIAERRGVKPSTIKTQLGSLAAKMGCVRQSEIAARVAGLPPIGG